MPLFQKPDLSRFKPDFTPVTKFLSGQADHFGLGHKHLDTLLDDYVSKLDATLGSGTTSQKIESLLALRGEAQTAFTARSAAETQFGLFAAVAAAGETLLGGIAVSLAVSAASLFPITLAAGGALYALALARSAFRNRAQADIDRHTMAQQINAEVVRLAEANPQEAAQSPRFKASLRSDFVNATAPYQADAFKELKARVDVFRGKQAGIKAAAVKTIAPPEAW